MARRSCLLFNRGRDLFREINVFMIKKLSSKKKLSVLDGRIIDRLQQGVPFVERPWDAIADDLDIDSATLLKSIKRLKKDGEIRRIAATFDPRKVGFSSTLVAVKIDLKKIDRVARRINVYDEVTHNYKRDAEYNLWFAMVASSRRRILQVIKEIKNDPEIEAILELPATRLFKIEVNFGKNGRKNR